MIIDFHTHVLPPRVRDERSRYVEKDAAFAAIYNQAKAAIATTDDLIETMDREGIDFSVIVNYSWSTAAFCRETNDYILESIARYPDRLAGFCAVSDFVSDDSLREAERGLAAGARGIGELRPDFHPGDFTDKLTMQPFVDILAARDAMLLLHTSEPVGHKYAGKGDATPGLVYPFLESFPELRVICAHWGGGLPFYVFMPEVRRALTNVYFDTAASPFLYEKGIYAEVVRLAGAEKVLFGSDYPVMPPKRLLDEIRSAELTDKERDMLLAGNARRLLDR